MLPAAGNRSEPWESCIVPGLVLTQTKQSPESEETGKTSLGLETWEQSGCEAEQGEGDQILQAPTVPLDTSIPTNPPS